MASCSTRCAPWLQRSSMHRARAHAQWCPKPPPPRPRAPPLTPPLGYLHLLAGAEDGHTGWPGGQIRCLCEAPGTRRAAALLSRGSPGLAAAPREPAGGRVQWVSAGLLAPMPKARAVRPVSHVLSAGPNRWCAAAAALTLPRSLTSSGPTGSYRTRPCLRGSTVSSQQSSCPSGA